MKVKIGLIFFALAAGAVSMSREAKAQEKTVNYLGHVEVGGKVVPGSGTAAPALRPIARTTHGCECNDYACWHREINHNGQHAVGGCGVSALTLGLGRAFNATRIAECVAAGADTVNILMSNRDTLVRALHHCRSQGLRIDTAAGLAECQSRLATSTILDASTAASFVSCLAGEHVEVAKHVPLAVAGALAECFGSALNGARLLIGNTACLISDLKNLWESQARTERMLADAARGRFNPPLEIPSPGKPPLCLNAPTDCSFLFMRNYGAHLYTTLTRFLSFSRERYCQELCGNNAGAAESCSSYIDFMRTNSIPGFGGCSIACRKPQCNDALRACVVSCSG